MPMAPLKACPTPGCPELYPPGGQCPIHGRRRTTWPDQPRGRWIGTTKRAMVLRRDRNTCTNCGAKAAEVHHIVSRANGGGDEMDNLTSLCRPCHANLTYRQPRPPRLVPRPYPDAP